MQARMAQEAICEETKRRDYNRQYQSICVNLEHYGGKTRLIGQGRTKKSRKAEQEKSQQAAVEDTLRWKAEK